MCLIEVICKKTGNEVKLEYIENDVRILEYGFNSFVNLKIGTYKVNTLH